MIQLLRTKGGSTCRKFSDAQVSKSIKFCLYSENIVLKFELSLLPVTGPKIRVEFTL